MGVFTFIIMTERKSLSKKIRFEVFKRDNFTCQYCGSKAPEVILEVDHIKPVSKGGNSEIMNLVTSCFTCNRGKGKNKLSDLSVVEKQRLQIEELNIRRQQLEMMLEWRDGIDKLKTTEHSRAIDKFNSHFSKYKLNPNGETRIKKSVKKYGLINVLDMIEEVYDHYSLKESDEGDLFELVLKNVGAWLNLNNQPETAKKSAYIKGICRNKFNYFNEIQYSVIMKQCIELNINLDKLKQSLIDNCYRNWSSLRESLNDFIEEQNSLKKMLEDEL